jgi:hypothetical protein
MTLTDPIDHHLSKEEVLMFGAGAAASVAGMFFAAGGLL